jgi:hypothetical protein
MKYGSTINLYVSFSCVLATNLITEGTKWRKKKDS